LDIAVYDANPKIAKYWYHDFLELHESKTDEYNTRTAFKSIKSVLDNAVSCTGAYTYSMSSNYNALPRPAIVLVADGRAEVIVEREKWGDLVRLHRIPDHLL